MNIPKKVKQEIDSLLIFAKLNNYDIKTEINNSMFSHIMYIFEDMVNFKRYELTLNFSKKENSEEDELYMVTLKGYAHGFYVNSNVTGDLLFPINVAKITLC